MPKVTKCLINYPKQRLDCINSHGTEFEITFKDPDADKHVCIPGDQFVDMLSWIKEFMTILTSNATRK